MLCKEPPNGERYAPSGVLVGGIGHHPGALPGRDNATLPEPTPSHAKCLKTRTPQNARTPTTTPALASGASVVSVFFRGSGSIIKRDMADRYRVGPSETVVQHDRHVHPSLASLRQLKGRSRPYTSAGYSHYTERRNRWQLVVT
jgi:hypothetical protein